MDPMEAKEFLASRIVDQALLEDVPFSEIERRMLFFSETHPSLPDMYEVLNEFNETYNMFPYERTVSSLICNAFRRDREDAALTQRWEDAKKNLRGEDHYINVMLNQGLASANRKRDLLIYIGIGLAVVFVIVGVIAWSH
jgi:hypothetical protein